MNFSILTLVDDSLKPLKNPKRYFLSIVDNPFYEEYYYHIPILEYVHVMRKGSDEMNDLINIFKVLSDETRLRTIMLLHFDELCVCEIGGILDIPQPTISKGLSKLRDLNLVVDTRKEKYVYYKLREDDMILKNIILDIASNLEKYPRLQEDFKNISTKWKFTNTPTPIDKNILENKF